MPDWQQKTAVAIDIETTGLRRTSCDITVIGIAVEKAGQIIPSYQMDTITSDWILETLKGVDELYTYNGSRFDLPFIKGKLGLDLKLGSWP